jgi:hypothetical protein
MKNANAGAGSARGTFQPFLALLLAAACVPYEGKEALNEPNPGGFGPPPNGGPQPGVGGRGGGPRPSWLDGNPVSSARELPPISGGTLLVLADGNTAVAADSDRDQVSVVDLVGERLLGTVALEQGDEPGRVVQSGPNSVAVLLRGSGAIAQIDTAVGTLVHRQPICSAPRGIDRDTNRNVLVVACGGGELITLAADTLAEQGRVMVERDLRDVVVSGTKLMVSRFRSAEVLVLDSNGNEERRMAPPGSSAANQPPGLRQRRPAPTPTTTPTQPDPRVVRAAEPAVAWRLRPRPAGGVLMLHQEASNDDLGVETGGYAGGGGCNGPVATAVSEFTDAGSRRTGPQLAFMALPVDFALSPDGKKMAVVAAANMEGTIARNQPPVGVYSARMDATTSGPCVFPPPGGAPDPEPVELRLPAGRPVAIAFDGQGRVVVQTREPARVEILSHSGGSVRLSQESRVDTGRDLFHMATQAALACASCHPEGGDDGHVWRFAGLGPRRSQNLRGGILKTAPFHWNGEMRDMSQLMTDVFSERMAGPRLEPREIEVLASWIDRLPALPALAAMAPRGAPMPDPAAVDRGRALFNDAAVGCATCHSGPMFTNNMSVGVGRAEVLQVPSLRGVGWRAPFMHDGCARTLMDRFDPTCGGQVHGNTAGLSQAQKVDLAMFLETL